LLFNFVHVFNCSFVLIITLVAWQFRGSAVGVAAGCGAGQPQGL
jgi:hypothetical protein